MSLQLQPLFILHYPKLSTVDEAAVNTAVDPLVVVQGDDAYERKHAQIRVIPFNKDNVYKEVLSFAEKVVFYRKTLRNILRKANELTEIPEDTTVCALVSNFFDLKDGTDQEYNEFLNGWNTKPVTGYEGDLEGFFGDHYLDLSTAALTEFNTGMGL